MSRGVAVGRDKEGHKQESFKLMRFRDSSAMKRRESGVTWSSKKMGHNLEALVVLKTLINGK